MNKFFVIGSINMDLVLQIDKFPIPGETITAKNLSFLPGGKGANQAVALARLQQKFGTPDETHRTKNTNNKQQVDTVYMCGKVGNDEWGRTYSSILADEHIDIANIESLDNISTGSAFIEVDNKGQNRIVVISGANSTIDRAYIDKCIALIGSFANPNTHATTPSSIETSQKIQTPCFLEKTFVLLQLEIPLDSVCYALETLATIPNIVTILDPAPAQELPIDSYKYIDFITPNESEASILTDLQISSTEDITTAAKILLDRGATHVVIKAGAEGSYYFTSSDSNNQYVPALKGINVVDTTAAGDSFNAGLAYGLSSGNSIADALRLANTVAGISTTKYGAQSAMPSMEDVLQWLDK